MVGDGVVWWLSMTSHGAVSTARLAWASTLCPSRGPTACVGDSTTV